MKKINLKKYISPLAMCLLISVYMTSCGNSDAEEFKSAEEIIVDSYGENASGDLTNSDESGSGGEDSTLEEGNDSENATETVKAAPTEEELLEAEIDEIIDELTLEEKVAQMFMVTPEALTGVETATVAGETTENAIIACPVGGIIYFAKNLLSYDQTVEMLKNTYAFYEDNDLIIPLLSVDEEGGTVARIANNSAFGVANVGTMRNIGDSGDTDNAKEVGKTIGQYLSDLGFNMDMAPDADVITNEANTVIGDRSFGTDPDLVADMVVAEIEGMTSKGLIPVVKHFPGHGATEADSHEGYAYTNRTLDELMEAELVPFKAAIDAGVSVVMVGHIYTPNASGDNLPASLSEYMITDILRDELGFGGIVITDAMNMGAITTDYSSSNAAVKAVKAGVDIILMPADFNSAYQGVLNAVESGNISEDRIDESLRRILRVKLDM